MMAVLMNQEFQRRHRETNGQIRRVLSRWEAPSPFRSDAKGWRALAEAYHARWLFYSDVIDHSITDPTVIADDVLFAALLDARTGCEEWARKAEQEARDAARRDQDRAWRSYADNLATTRTQDLLAGVA
jgi:hypothetical protein